MALLPLCSFPELDSSAIVEGVHTKLRIFKRNHGEETLDKKDCLKRIQGKYVLLIFYPKNFDPVAQLELISFSESLDAFEDLNCQLFGCSTDSVISHLDWLSTPRSEGGLEHLQVPLIPDTAGTLASGVGIRREGSAMSALYLVDPGGLVRYVSVTDPTVRRSPREVIRILKLLKSSKPTHQDEKEMVIELWNVKENELVTNVEVDKEGESKEEKMEGDDDDDVKKEVVVIEDEEEILEKVQTEMKSNKNNSPDEDWSLDFLDLSVSSKDNQQKEKSKGVPPKVTMRRKNCSEGDKKHIIPDKKSIEVKDVRQASISYLTAMDIIDNVFDSAYNSVENDSYINEAIKNDTSSMCSETDSGVDNMKAGEKSPMILERRKDSLKNIEIIPTMNQDKIDSHKIKEVGLIKHTEGKESPIIVGMSPKDSAKIVNRNPYISKDPKDSPKTTGMTPTIHRDQKDSPKVIKMSPMIPARQKDSPKMILSKKQKDSPKLIKMNAISNMEQRDKTKVSGVSSAITKDMENSPKITKMSPIITNDKRNSPQVVRMSPIIPKDGKDSVNIAGKGPVKLKSIVKTTGSAADTDKNSRGIIEKIPISQPEQNTQDDDKRVKDKMRIEDYSNTEQDKTVSSEQNSSAIAPRHRSRSKRRPPRGTAEQSFSSESNEEQKTEELRNGRTENIEIQHIATNREQSRSRGRRRPPRELSMSSESNDDWTITEKSVAAKNATSAVSIIAPRQRSLSMRRPPVGVIDQSMSSESNDESGREYRLDKVVTFQKRGSNEEDFRKVIMTSAVKNPPILVKAKTDTMNSKLLSGKTLDERTRSNTRANAVNAGNLPMVVKPRASSAVALTRTTQHQAPTSNCNIQ